MNKKINCLQLTDWHTLPYAAVQLGISRQSMFQKAEDGELKSLKFLPGEDPDKRPAAYVISDEELQEMRGVQEKARQAAAERAQAAQDKAAAKAAAKAPEPAALAS